MIKKIWLNLPVKDVEKSKKFFYKIGFSFNEKYDTVSSACLLVGENDFIIVLFEESMFASFTQNELVNTKMSSEVLFSIDAESRDEVDSFAVNVIEAGGVIFAKPSEIQPWMYGCGFEDLDGHRWHILHMDLSKK